MTYYFWLGREADLMARYYHWMVPLRCSWEEWLHDISRAEP